MLFDDPTKRYPHLVQALHTLGRRQTNPGAQINGPAGATLILVTFATLILVGGGWPLLSLFLYGLAVLPATSAIRVVRNAKPPISPRTREATLVAQRMTLMLTKRRIHRDLDSGTLVLLEECARNWLRAKAALEAPFWTAGLVPEHYRNVRSQALQALDDSMDDVLIEFQAWVPDHVQNRETIDYVEEALETFVGKSKRNVNFPPPAFVPVRVIADKLRSLADETERMSREARVDPEAVAATAPGRSLEQTLSELRSIQQAEEELRENLRG